MANLHVLGPHVPGCENHLIFPSQRQWTSYWTVSALVGQNVALLHHNKSLPRGWSSGPAAILQKVPHLWDKSYQKKSKNIHDKPTGISHGVCPAPAHQKFFYFCAKTGCCNPRYYCHTPIPSTIIDDAALAPSALSYAYSCKRTPASPW